MWIWRFLILFPLLNLDEIVVGEPDPADQYGTPAQELLTKYLLARLLGKEKIYDQDQNEGDPNKREDQDSSGSIIYPQVAEQSISLPLQKLLDQAKANIDVIDFRNPQKKYDTDNHDRYPRQPEKFHPKSDDYPDQFPHPNSAPSDAIPVVLPFPGTQTVKHDSGEQSKLPLTKIGAKKYYLGIFFKANWYKSEQFCRYHGMHLASINSRSEQEELQNHIQSFGMGHEHFWTSGTDQAEEGKFFWMSTGSPITFENWNAGEPNNFQYENGEQEHCLELWNRDGKGLRWNDTPCSFETFFVCEL